MGHNFHHLLRIHRIRKELKEVYANQLIDGFAINLLRVFVPIYLIILGFSLQSSLFFMVTFSLTGIAMCLPTAFLSSRVGLKHAILYRAPVLVFFTYLLYSIPSAGSGNALMLLTAMVWGISHSLYWIPFHAKFIKNSDKLHEGEEVGILMALSMTAATFAPAIGGLLLTYFSFHLVFVLFALLVVVSIVPLFLTSDYKKVFRLNMSRWNWKLSRAYHVGFFSNGLLYSSEFVLWPIYTFVVFGDTVTVGVSTTLILVGLSMFTFITGKMSDRIKKDRILKVGAVAYSILWVSRIFAQTRLEFFLLSFLGGMFYTLIKIPFFTQFCNFAKSRGRMVLDDSSIRQIWVYAGMTAIYLPVVVLPIDLTATFLITAVISLLFLWIEPD